MGTYYTLVNSQAGASSGSPDGFDFTPENLFPETQAGDVMALFIVGLDTDYPGFGPFIEFVPYKNGSQVTNPFGRGSGNAETQNAAWHQNSGSLAYHNPFTNTLPYYSNLFAVEAGSGTWTIHVTSSTPTSYAYIAALIRPAAGAPDGLIVETSQGFGNNNVRETFTAPGGVEAHPLGTYEWFDSSPDTTFDGRVANDGTKNWLILVGLMGLELPTIGPQNFLQRPLSTIASQVAEGVDSFEGERALSIGILERTAAFGEVDVNNPTDMDHYIVEFSSGEYGISMSVAALVSVAGPAAPSTGGGQLASRAKKTHYENLPYEVSSAMLRRR